METPSSNRRLTRSQTKAALNNTNIRKIEDLGEKGSAAKSQRRNGNNNKNNEEENRCALIDITNDSPIVGVAMSRSETPLQRSNRISKMIKTPGSGEALLRGQVKALLQKVEEEGGGEHVSKISIENRPFLHLQGFVVNSPTRLLAPTPANTPQIPNLSGDHNDDDDDSINASFTPLPVIQEQLKICQVVGEISDEGSIESEKSVTRSLLLDFFSEKSESEISSVVTTEEDMDSASNWSIQVNASTHEDEDEDEDYIEEEEEEEEGGGGGWMDEVCEGMGKISISSKFEGKHKKFEYNSDDEIVESECGGGILHLKGLPTPKGKHLRFATEED